MLWISWKSGSTWTQPEPIASAPRIFNFTFDSDEHGNIIVVWTENDRIWSRAYAPVNEILGAEEQFVATTSSNASVGNVDMTNGNAILSFSTDDPTRSRWVAVYEAGNGWVESWQVRLDDQQGGVAGIALDDAGNGIAICVPAGLGTQSEGMWRELGGNRLLCPRSVSTPVSFHAAAAFDRSVSFVTSTAQGALCHELFALNSCGWSPEDGSPVRRAAFQSRRRAPLEAVRFAHDSSPGCLSAAFANDRARLETALR